MSVDEIANLLLGAEMNLSAFITGLTRTGLSIEGTTLDNIDIPLIIAILYGVPVIDNEDAYNAVAEESAKMDCYDSQTYDVFLQRIKECAKSYGVTPPHTCAVVKKFYLTLA